MFPLSLSVSLLILCWVINHLLNLQDEVETELRKIPFVKFTCFHSLDYTWRNHLQKNYFQALLRFPILSIILNINIVINDLRIFMFPPVAYKLSHKSLA